MVCRLDNLVLDFRRGVIASRLNKFCQLACVSFIFISHVLVAKQLKAVRRSENQGGGAQCPKWRNIAKKLRFFSKPNWVARINIWIMPIQNLALLSYFGTSKLPILVPKVGCLRQNFRFDFTVVILLSKFLEKLNKVRAENSWGSARVSSRQKRVSNQNFMNFHLN